MGFHTVFFVAADAEVVDAHGHYPARGEMARGVLGDVNEVFIKVIGLPTAGGVAGFE